MKFLGKINEIEGLKIERSYRKKDDKNKYFEILKKEKVGHIDKEIPLFQNEIDAEEWINENIEKMKFGTDGLDEEDLTYLYSGDIKIFESTKEDLKSSLKGLLKKIENHGKNSFIGYRGKSYLAILNDEIHYNLKTKVIEMPERSKEQEKAYREYKFIKSEYSKEKEILGGNIFSVIKFNVYLLSALTILFMYLGIMGVLKAQVGSEGMWPFFTMMGIVLLPVSIPMLIHSIKKYREILHAKRELKFIVNTVV